MNMRVSETAVPAPPAPRQLEDLGLHPVLLRDLLLKTMFRQNLSTAAEVSRGMCLPLPLAQELIDIARAQKLVEATGTLRGSGSSEMGFQLTESGKARALDALSQSEYHGAAPVPLDAYREQVRRQSVRNIRITPERLKAAMGHLILPEGFLDELGPAITSGRSVLMYGPPGNGKSSIAEGIRQALGDTIWVPRAVEYAGQVIAVFDPIVHTPAEEEGETGSSGLRLAGSRHDRRYIRCKRPAVMTGGELTLDMLDLRYNPVARTYQAPLQMKATGGVFIVDDLGRQ
ncbi:MAG: ATPase, partial [Alphaproteobacteria bacterium]